MKMSFMTCPGREPYADYLKKQLPEAEVIFDTEKNATKNFIKMLRSAGDHEALLMEDDIILCSDFVKKINDVVSKRGSMLINFFSRRGRDLTHGSRIEPGRSFNYNCCVYYPAGWAREVANYYDRWTRREQELIGHGFDYLVADWLSENSLSYFLHVPSLVQHREGLSSIDKRRPRSRQSKTFNE